MSYATEKGKVNTTRKKFKRILFILALVLIIFFSAFSLSYKASSWKYYLALPSITARGEGELRVHFIDVGQGDATLVELPDGKVMLIDGGNGTGNSNKSLLRHLNALGIDTIDYLFLTHADIDHYGGLTTVLEEKEVLRVFLPLETETPTASYEKFYVAVMEEGCPYSYACPPNSEHPEMRLSVNEGDTQYTLVVLYPYIQTVDSKEKVAKDDNASSVVIWLDYQGTSILFTGDAPSATETLLMRDDRLGLHTRYGVDIKNTEILKTAHHGSDDSTSEAFLEYINCKTAVVSCGEDNAYQHPSKKTLERLENEQVELFRTDKDGSVIVTATKAGNYSVHTLGK